MVRIAVLHAVAIEIDAILNEGHEPPCISRGLLSRLPSFERSERRDLFFIIAYGHSLVVELMFEQSENMAII